MLKKIIQWIGGAERSLENPSVSLLDPAVWAELGLGGGNSSAGIQVNRETALQYDAVWRGVSLIAGSVSRIKLLTYKQSGKHWELDKEHPIYHLLKRSPLPEITARVFKQTLTAHAVLHGAGYAWIQRDSNGTPVGLWPLLPENTKPLREYLPDYGMRAKLWYVTLAGNEYVKLAADDVLCIMGLSHDGWTPYSVFDKARDSIGLGLAQSKFTSKFFSSGAEPRVVIEVPAGTNWKDTAQQEFLRQWNAMHQGLDNAHKTAILTGGASVKPFSITSQDAELLNSRKFSVVEIANWLGVPPHKLGNADKASYNSLEQENQSFLDDGLETWLQAWEDECELKLLTEEEKRLETHKVEFYRKGLVRPTMDQRFAAYSVGINSRVLNPNECRAEEGLAPYEGGDEYLVPLNIGSPGGDPLAKPQGEVPEEPEEDIVPTNDSEIPRAIPDKILTSHRDLVVDACKRAIKRLGNHVKRASEKPDSFIKTLDGLESEHKAVILGILRPVIAASQAVLGGETDRTNEIVDKIFATLHEELLDLSGKCKRSELSGSVELFLNSKESRGPEELADLIIRKKTILEGITQ